MKHAKVTINGDRLMMRNVRLVDPLDEYSKRIRILSVKRQKSDEEHLQLSRLDWEGGMYFDEALGPYVPDQWLVRAMREGATKRKLGKLFAANVTVLEEKIPLQYDGPRTLAGLWSGGTRFVDRRAVGMGQKKVMRTRPIFHDWSLSFTIGVFESAVRLEDAEEALDEIGPRGIGDGRTMGLAGKFTVMSFKETKPK